MKRINIALVTLFVVLFLHLPFSLAAQCLPDLGNGNICTAKDFVLSEVVISGPTSCTEGEIISQPISVRFGVQPTANERYDIGLFVGDHGESPIQGDSCTFSSLTPIENGGIFDGQIVLSLALFAFVAYFWCSTKKSICYGKFFVLFLTSALIAALVVSGAGWLARHLLIPFLTEQITRSTTLSYNPEQAISFTLDLQIFIWISLVGPTPGLTWTRKLLIGFLGALITMIAFAGGVAAIETLYLTPHKGLYKLSVILLPFAAYYFCFLRSETGPVSTRLSQEERTCI